MDDTEGEVGGPRYRKGCGAFLAEEEPEETAEVVRSFYERHV